MNMGVTAILSIIAIIMAVAGIIKPQWPLVAVGLLLLSIAVLVMGK